MLIVQQCLLLAAEKYCHLTVGEYSDQKVFSSPPLAAGIPGCHADTRDISDLFHVFHRLPSVRNPGARGLGPKPGMGGVTILPSRHPL